MATTSTSVRQVLPRTSIPMATTSTIPVDTDESYASKELVKTAMSDAQKLIQQKVPTFKEVDIFTKQALLAGKLNLRDDNLRDRFAGRRKKTQVDKPWVFSQQPPDDENRDVNGVAPPSNYSIHQLIDTGGDFDHLQSQLPHEIKFLLGGNDHKGKDCMLPGAVRFLRGFTARITAILDFQLKINPVVNHWLATLTTTLLTEHKGLTTLQKAVEPHLSMITEIEKVQSSLLFANGMLVEEMIDLAKFFKFERGKTLDDAVKIENLHRKKLKERPVKKKEQLLNTGVELPVSTTSARKTVKTESWNSVQNATTKVLGWDSTLSFSTHMRKELKKRKNGGTNPNPAKRPFVKSEFARNTRNRDGRGRGDRLRRERNRKRAQRQKADAKRRKERDAKAPG